MTKISYKNKILVFLAVLLILFSCMPFAAFANSDTSGKIDGIEWSYVAGNLEIVGKGAMPDFTEENPAPWQKFNAEIVQVSIDRRISAIGTLAFYDCRELLAVSLSNNVKTIGDMAFAGCERLRVINMPSVTRIGEYAFSRCFALNDVVLPTTLTEIGKNAFYRCESIYAITVPESVTVFGSSVFAYCKGLVSANIKAKIEKLPEWTFYGCEKLDVIVLAESVTDIGEMAFERCDVLTYIYHTGGEDVTEQFKENISTKVDSIYDFSIDSNPETIPPAKDNDFEQQGDKFISTDTTVETTENSVIKTETVKTHPATEGGYDEKVEDAKIEINATVSSKDGWEDVLQKLDNEYVNRGTLESETKNDVPITANVTLLDGSYIYRKTLERLASNRVTVNVTTPDGSMWTIDGKQLSGYSFKSKYNLKYSISVNASPKSAHKKVIGGAASFVLETTDKIDFPITLKAYLEVIAKNHTATLYESTFGGALKSLKSMVVDSEGVASYKLKNVNKGKFIIALDVAGVGPQDTEITENPNENADWLENYVPVTEQYTVTDVRGFMGMTMKQFTTVLICAIVILAFVIFVLILVVNLFAKKKAIDNLRNKKSE